MIQTLEKPTLGMSGKELSTQAVNQLANQTSNLQNRQGSVRRIPILGMQRNIG